MLKLTRIEKVRFVRKIDESPDLDWIGTFSNTSEEGAINHHERNGVSHNTYKWFNPANPEYAEQEYADMMRIVRGNTSFYGISTEAVIYLSGVRQVITSGGLWGCEHDGSKASEAHFKEEEKQQLDELKDILTNDLNFEKADILKALANVEPAK